MGSLKWQWKHFLERNFCKQSTLELKQQCFSVKKRSIEYLLKEGPFYIFCCTWKNWQKLAEKIATYWDPRRHMWLKARSAWSGHLFALSTTGWNKSRNEECRMSSMILPCTTSRFTRKPLGPFKAAITLILKRAIFRLRSSNRLAQDLELGFKIQEGHGSAISCHWPILQHAMRPHHQTCPGTCPIMRMQWCMPGISMGKRHLSDLVSWEMLWYWMPIELFVWIFLAYAESSDTCSGRDSWLHANGIRIVQTVDHLASTQKVQYVQSHDCFQDLPGPPSGCCETLWDIVRLWVKLCQNCVWMCLDHSGSGREWWTPFWLGSGVWLRSWPGPCSLTHSHPLWGGTCMWWVHVVHGCWVSESTLLYLLCA